MTNQRVAQRYAKSLVDLAQERGQLETIKGDVDSFLKMGENRDFRLLLNSPVVNPDKKKSIIKALLERASANELTSAFVNLVIAKGRETDLLGIFREFVNQYKTINHISTVKVTSAAPLSEAELAAIRQQLIASGKTEASVDFKTAIDEDLIGGFVLEFDGKVYDASVAHKLSELRKELRKPNVYQNQLAG